MASAAYFVLSEVFSLKGVALEYAILTLSTALKKCQVLGSDRRKPERTAG